MKATATIVLTVHYDLGRENAVALQATLQDSVYCAIRFDGLLKGYFGARVENYNLDITVAEVNETPLRTDGDRAGQTLLPGRPGEPTASD